MASYFDIIRLTLRSGHRASRAAAVLLAVSPPVICALFARGPDRWDLFERCGALTTTIGRLLASRRYLQRGILEIAIIDQNHGYKSNMLELVEDIHATKLGLAVSAFGTIIWGAGKYLQWWTFSYLIVWAAIAAFDAWRDFVRLRDTPIGDLSAEKTRHPAPWRGNSSQPFNMLWQMGCKHAVFYLGQRWKNGRPQTISSSGPLADSMMRAANYCGQ